MKNKKWQQALLAGLFVLLMSGCDGISGTGGPSRVADDTEKQTPQDGQAILGPVVDATVTVRDVEALNDIACSTTTTDNNDLALAGGIAFSEPCIYADRVYLVTIAGGNDIDFDDDSNRDATPTPNTGEFRALMSGAQLLQNNWKTNALTEAAYQAIQYKLKEGGIHVTATLGNIAQQYIHTDLNADGVIDWLDIAFWSPVENASDASNTDKLRFSTELIHQNLNRTLANIPAAASLAGRIDTLAPARQVLEYSSHLLVTTDSALLIYSKQTSDWQLDANVPLGWVYDMAASAETLYVALGDNGIAAINLADPGNPRVTQRWNIATRRIATLGNHIVFAYRTDNSSLQLRELVGTESQLIADSKERLYDAVRAHATDDTARNGMLKTIDSTVYWSTQGIVYGYTLENDTWIEQSLPATLNEFPPLLAFDIVDDIEIRNTTAYVTARRGTPSLVSLLADSLDYFYAREEDKFEHATAFIEPQRIVSLINIADINNPHFIDSVAGEDIDAIRRWDDVVIALGARNISVRNPVDLQADTQIALPSSFSGFDPVHGLTRVDTAIAVAARENGVLLLTPPITQVHNYTGHVTSLSAVSGATVVVRRLADNETVCSPRSDANGSVSIASDCIAEPGYYLLSASGGTENINSVDKPFMGELRVVMHANDIANLNWNISPLTEIALRIASTGDGSDFRSFIFAQDDIADWLLAGVRGEQESVASLKAADLFNWQPGEHTPNIDAQILRDATSALDRGEFNPSSLADIIAPVTNLLAFDSGISAVVTNANATFVAHENSIDIINRSVSPWQRHSMAGGATALQLADNTLIAFDQRSGRIDLYAVSNLQNISRITTFLLPGFAATPILATYCLADATLYELSYLDDDISSLAVRAWHLDSQAALPTQSSISVNSPGLIFDRKIRCDDSLVAFSLNASVEVLHFTAGGIDEQVTVGTTNVYDIDLHDNTLVVYSSGDASDSLATYRINSDSRVTSIRQVAVASNPHKRLSKYNVLNNDGATVSVLMNGSIEFFNADTLQPAGSVATRFYADQFTAGADAVWLWDGGSTLFPWGIGKGVWQIPTPTQQ